MRTLFRFGKFGATLLDYTILGEWFLLPTISITIWRPVVHLAFLKYEIDVGILDEEEDQS